MSGISDILLAGKPILADGAIGTMLHVRRFPAGECPESWCITHPAVVKEITTAYLDAGAILIGTNSLGGTHFKLRHFGLDDQVVAFNTAAVRLAREAAEGRGFVTATVGPTGCIVEDEGGEVTEEELYTAFRQQMVAQATAGADAFCIETMSSLIEATAAIRAAKENTALPVFCTFTFARGTGGFRTMMGVDPGRAAREAVAAGTQVVGANCGNGITEMIDIARLMHAAVPVTPILIQPNAGMPILREGKAVFTETPEEMARHVPDLIAAGAGILGGCCGTTPGHIAAMAQVIQGS